MDLFAQAAEAGVSVTAIVYGLATAIAAMAGGIGVAFGQLWKKLNLLDKRASECEKDRANIWREIAGKKSPTTR